MENKKVLIIGIDPFLIDFTTAEYAAFPDLTPEKVEMGIKASIQQLQQMNYDADLCWVDFGLTASNVLGKKIKQQTFDVVLIGAGIRMPGQNLLLFEELLNVVHQHASKARICFNTNPGDTIAAVERVIVS